MLPLFLATCSIVIGLGMVVPLLPFYAVAYGGSAWDVAMLFAIYSACQFLTAPLWGRLSDRVGRKPVLLLCFAGTAVSYVWYAYAGSLTEMYLSRALAGAMAAWLVAGQAWVADSTGPDGRARGMGLLGAAFGIGFVIGPTIGAIAVGADDPNFRMPILFSAAASALAFVIAAFLIREPKTHVARDGDIADTDRAYALHAAAGDSAGHLFRGLFRLRRHGIDAGPVGQGGAGAGAARCRAADGLRRGLHGDRAGRAAGAAGRALRRGAPHRGRHRVIAAPASWRCRWPAAGP